VSSAAHAGDAAVQAALGAAFPGRAAADLEPLGGGLSGSLVLAFRVDGAAYVLRKGDVDGAPREIACLRVASARGLAPRVVFADERTGVSIMERVQGAQLGRSGPSDPERVARLARAVRRLHDGPPFSRRPTLVEALRRMDGDMSAATGHRLPPELVRLVETLADVTAADAHAAPCHNDLNPNNVLVAPDEIHFVDWATAGAGDPYLDIAQLVVFALPAPAQRDAFLSAYLRREPTGDERARARVARGMALAVYAASFFMVAARVGAAAGGGSWRGLPLPELFAMLATARERAHPGVVAASLLLAAQGEVGAPGFEDACERVARRSRSPEV
jgi:aminoglycoside phosphotransferase (APT) family kinase protein